MHTKHAPAHYAELGKPGPRCGPTTPHSHTIAATTTPHSASAHCAHHDELGDQDHVVVPAGPQPCTHPPPPHIHRNTCPHSLTPTHAHHDELGDQVHVVVPAGPQLRRRLLAGPEPLVQLRGGGVGWWVGGALLRGAVCEGEYAGPRHVRCHSRIHHPTVGNTEPPQVVLQPAPSWHTSIPLFIHGLRQTLPELPLPLPEHPSRRSPPTAAAPSAHLVQVERGRLAAIVVVAVDVEHLQRPENSQYAPLSRQKCRGSGSAQRAGAGRQPPAAQPAACRRRRTFRPSTDSRPLMMHSCEAGDGADQGPRGWLPR